MRVASPFSGTPSSFCVAFASGTSASVHCGKPTATMFSNIVSASVRFMCDGHAEPRTRDDHLVLVISAAPSAILSPISHMLLMRS